MSSKSIAELPRLNPFAFPSETSFRFALLIISVIGVSLMIFNILYSAYPNHRERDKALEIECQQKAYDHFPLNSYTWIPVNVNITVAKSFSD